MSDTAAPRLKPCPICGKLAAPASRPFCSPGCADVDLNRWLSGIYALPLAESEEDEERYSRKETD